jgi:cellulose synthase/poly-beta-1,6-N-acetylglucosamine synthase-like glycosyltransferase
MNGWKTTANLEMKAWTEVPLSLKELWKQRLRWLRGGVDALREIGWNKATKKDILGHFLFVFLSSVQVFFSLLACCQLANKSSWILNPWVFIVIGLGGSILCTD